MAIYLNDMRQIQQGLLKELFSDSARFSRTAKSIIFIKFHRIFRKKSFFVEIGVNSIKFISLYFWPKIPKKPKKSTISQKSTSSTAPLPSVFLHKLTNSSESDTIISICQISESYLCEYTLENMI